MHNEIQNELDNNIESTSFENQNNVEAPTTQFEDGGESGETTSTDATEGVPEGGEAPEQGDTIPEESAEGIEGSSNPVETSETSLESSAVVDGVELNDADKEILKTLGDDYAPEGETKEEALVKDGATNVPTQILQNAKAKNEEKKKNEDEKEKSDSEKSEDNTEDNEEKKKKKFSLEQELAELQTKFAALQAENAELLAFKQKVEEKEKDELIASFYMLSDEDKKDVIENKAKYSLKEIKAELSIICVDKKVNFNLENASSVEEAPVTFNLNSHQADNLPAWLKAVEDTRNRNK